MMILYAIYNDQTKVVTQKGYCPVEMIPVMVGFSHLELTQEQYDSLVLGDVVFDEQTQDIQVDPARKEAGDYVKQWDRIKQIRDSLREGVVTLTNSWRVDADKDSVNTMQERIDMWGVGTNTMVDGKQMWKGADNDVRLFTQSEFTDFVLAVRTARALKVDMNFAFAEYMRAQLPLAEDHAVFTPTNWPG